MHKWKQCHTAKCQQAVHKIPIPCINYTSHFSYYPMYKTKWSMQMTDLLLLKEQDLFFSLAFLYWFHLVNMYYKIYTKSSHRTLISAKAILPVILLQISTLLTECQIHSTQKCVTYAHTCTFYRPFPPNLYFSASPVIWPIKHCFQEH